MHSRAPTPARASAAAADPFEKGGHSMSVAIAAEEEVYAESAAPVWWVFLITGTAWFVLSLIMFRFDITSAATIGILAGFVFLAAGVIELGMVAVVRSSWWKALNALLGVLLVVGGIAAFVHPKNAFVA